MVIYRSATFDDVEKLHKLLNDYAAEGLMLPRSRNSIYENLRVTWWPLRQSCIGAAHCTLFGIVWLRFVL